MGVPITDALKQVHFAVTPQSRAIAARTVRLINRQFNLELSTRSGDSFGPNPPSLQTPGHGERINVQV